MMNPGLLASGVVGAVAGAELGNMLDRDRFEKIMASAERIEHHLKNLAEHTKVLTDKPIQLTLVLQPGVYIPWNPFGKAYTLLFLNGASTVSFDVPGVGKTSLALSTGWSNINLPVGTLVGLPSSASASITALFRATDSPLGNTY